MLDTQVFTSRSLFFQFYIMHYPSICEQVETLYGNNKMESIQEIKHAELKKLVSRIAANKTSFNESKSQ